MNKYLSILLMTSLPNLGILAQSTEDVPKLVINITIDQLRTDYIERYSALYNNEGFKKLFTQGKVFQQPHYSFSPIDRSSSIASIATGCSPEYNGIISNYWLSRKNFKKLSCVDDEALITSPNHLLTSTIGDELKIASNGSALVYAIAEERDAAVLSAGHAADGALWIDDKNQNWNTSKFYSSSIQQWINAYNRVQDKDSQSSKNKRVVKMALDCIQNNALGRDNITDYIAITLSAQDNKNIKNNSEKEEIYVELDRLLAQILREVEQKIGKEKVLVMLTGTGYTEEKEADYKKFKVPTGTFYINRTAALLNMYLSAVYTKANFIEGYYQNQLYLNRKVIENKQLSVNDIYAKSKDFLLQNAGVLGVHQSKYPPAISGDIIIEITPGWKLLNEDTHETMSSNLAFVPFPLIFYGTNIQAEHIKSIVSINQIAPTLANIIHIRAPNACADLPLFLNK